MYYALTHAYGSVANGWPHYNNDGGGTRADLVYVFTSREARDAWVQDGNLDIYGPDYREPLSARSRTVRRVLAAERRGEPTLMHGHARWAGEGRRMKMRVCQNDKCPAHVLGTNVRQTWQGGPACPSCGCKAQELIVYPGPRDYRTGRKGELPPR